MDTVSNRSPSISFSCLETIELQGLLNALSCLFVLLRPRKGHTITALVYDLDIIVRCNQAREGKQGDRKASLHGSPQEEVNRFRTHGIRRIYRDSGVCGNEIMPKIGTWWEEIY